MRRAIKEGKISPQTRRNPLFDLAVLGNLVPGLVLAAALFMPQVTGCNNLPVRPVESLVLTAKEQPFAVFTVCWQHFYGLFVAALFVVVLCTNRETSDRKLAVATLGFWVLLISSTALATVADGKSLAPELLFGVLPLIGLPSLLFYWAWQRGDWISAWARLASSIALLGIPWTLFSYLFNRGSRYGIFVTYGCLLALAIAPWWLRVRWRQALISRSEPSTPIRFRVWHLLAASTVLAVAYGYYRYVVPAFAE